MGANNEATFRRVLAYHWPLIKGVPGLAWTVSSALCVPTIFEPVADAMKKLPAVKAWVESGAFRPSLWALAIALVIYQMAKENYVENDSRARRDAATILGLREELASKGTSWLEQTLRVLHDHVVSESCRADDVFAAICDRLAKGIVDSEFVRTVETVIGENMFPEAGRLPLIDLLYGLDLMKRSDRVTASYVRGPRANEVCLALKERRK